ncbi:MAG: TonB-dependent receptor [Bacteroidota bacterium]
MKKTKLHIDKKHGTISMQVSSYKSIAHFLEMKKVLFLLMLITILTLSKSYAQQPTQVIRGTVIDKQSQITLPGANVVIMNSNPPKGEATGADGRFKIGGVNPGRYDLQASFIGYKSVIIPNVVVLSGKEVVLEIALEENIKSLNEVVIKDSKKNETINRMAAVSARSFTMEEVNRYSGGRYDPSRLVSNFAGVSSPNDSRNDIVIRGNSPGGVLWRIEGLSVPNPNHFVTLGTTGGPVSTLNPNTLTNSDFFTSAFPAEYGNATAGVFDIRLRNGNTDKHEHMIQFGMLTGLEAMSEGPFKNGSQATYMAAYRYSFTGLAQNLGIPIGTKATPYYQDLTFKINSGETKLGRFTLFGLGGISHIDFLHNQIDSTDIFANPNQDGYSRSKIGVLGLSHFIRLSNKVYWSSVLGATYSENGYQLDTVSTISSPALARDSKDIEVRYSLNTFIDYKANARFNIKIGFQGDLHQLDLKLKDRQYTPDWNYIWDFNGNASLLAAYLQSKYRITEKFSLNVGLRSQYLTLNNATSFEPRLGLKYQFNEKHSVGVGFGIHSQMQPLTVYFYRFLKPDGTYDESNKKLDFTNSRHFVASYEVLPWSNWRVKTELYYQTIYNVPVSQSQNSLSILNEGASYAPIEEGNLKNKGTGTNYGLELTVEKFFSQGFYALLTGSMYESKYKGSDGVERNTAFNGNYVYNVLLGKEFKLGKAKRNAFSIDIKYSQAGGRYYTPVDLAASQAARQEVKMGDDYAYSKRYPDFYRLDVKAGFTYNSKKRNRSQSIFFDIQNVTGHKNIFAQQYNPVTKQVNTLYQIGFYPNFVYKIQF